MPQNSSQPPSATQQVLQAPPPEVLLEVKTLFPLDIFPAQIKLTSLSLVVIENHFLSSQTTTFMLVDILNVEMTTSLLASTITIIRKQSPLPPYQIKNIPNAEAEKLKNMIQGLIMLSNEKVDVARADSTQVKKKAMVIGEVTA